MPRLSQQTALGSALPRATDAAGALRNFDFGQSADLTQNKTPAAPQQIPEVRPIAIRGRLVLTPALAIASGARRRQRSHA